MLFQRREGLGSAGGGRLIQGILLGAALSIPLWAAIGVVVILLFQEGPITEAEIAAFTVAAAVELILLRFVWLVFRPRPAFRHLPARPAARAPLLRQTALLTGLVVAYLHYYFWDVQLQIAALQSVTVFVRA
jgi:hypothetical protein